MPSVLGMKPEAPNSMQRRITAGSSLADTTTIGSAGILRAQIHQAGKAAHAGHAQIEQDQIDVAAAFEQFGDLLEGAGLADFGAVEQAGDRFAQRAAEQRMIVGDQQMMRCAPRSTIMPVGLAQARQSNVTAVRQVRSTIQFCGRRRLSAGMPRNCSTTSRRCGRARCSAT